MTVKKIKEQAEARRMRAEGYSLKQIAEALGVSKGSVSAWVRDVTLTPAQESALKDRQKAQLAGAKANRAQAMAQRRQQQAIGRQQAQQGSQLHMQGCMLYWAEGAKRRNRIHFVNSDVHMMRLFTRFLREELTVQDDEIHLFIHLHVDYEPEVTRIKQFWFDALDLSEDNMRSVYVKPGSQSRKNILKNGIATICVYRTDLTMQLYGAIQEYGGFENPEWLF